jgi:hypothetical protein
LVRGLVIFSDFGLLVLFLDFDKVIVAEEIGAGVGAGVGEY